MFQIESGWMTTYKQAEALWIHDNNPLRPHALLSSGKHSSGFFNSELVMEMPIMLDYAAEDLVELALQADLDLNEIDCVTGPAMGAITLAHDVARNIDRRAPGRRALGKRACRRAYTEKLSSDDKTMVFKRTSIRPGEKILLTEDVLTTGGSVESTASAVYAADGEVLPFILVLVNRTPVKEIGDRKIISLIHQHMPIWTSDACPLCRQGSEAIHPKSRLNWARLNADYPQPESVPAK